MPLILATATTWNSETSKKASEIFTALQRKYNKDLTIATGYTAPHIGLATIANKLGIQVQIFAPDLTHVKAKHLEVCKGMTITSTERLDYYKYIASAVDSAVSFSNADPYTRQVLRTKKRVWFPLTGKTLN